MDKIPFQITAKKKGKVAQIRVIGEIGWQVSSADFRKEVDTLVKDGCTEANLYINSIGGSCFDANEIANILDESFSKVTGDGGAIVASAAAFLAAKCETFTMPSNGQFMVHRPRGGQWGTMKDLESYLKMLSDMDADYLEVFKAKAADPKDIEKRWESSSDYWMNAADAKKAGFVTSIREKVKTDKETNAMIRACADVSAKDRMTEFLINDNTNMEQVNALLKLPKDATEDDRMTAITALLDAKTKAEADLKIAQDSEKELQDKLDAIDAENKAAKTKEAEELTDAAILDGRLDDDEKKTTRAFWLKSFESDFEGTKAQMEKLPKKKNLSDNFTQNNGEDAWEKRQKEIEENSK